MYEWLYKIGLCSYFAIRTMFLKLKLILIENINLVFKGTCEEAQGDKTLIRFHSLEYVNILLYVGSTYSQLRFVNV